MPPKWTQLPLNRLKGSTKQPQHPHRVRTVHTLCLIVPLNQPLTASRCSVPKMGEILGWVGLVEATPQGSEIETATSCSTHQTVPVPWSEHMEDGSCSLGKIKDKREAQKNVLKSSR